MSYIWLTSCTVAQTDAFGQIDIFTTQKNYCDRIIGDIEMKIGTKLPNYSTFILIKNLKLCSFCLNSKLRKINSVFGKRKGALRKPSHFRNFMVCFKIFADGTNIEYILS